MEYYWTYFKYVVKHKVGVFLAGRKLGLGFWQLMLHDLSKFSVVEFIPYMRYFAVGDKSRQAKEAFHVAWLHHIHRNSHHWEHWILRHTDGGLTVLKMPDKYVREMVADWHGVAYALGKSSEGAVIWYTKNREMIALHPHTRSRVDYLMGIEAAIALEATVMLPRYREIGSS